MKFGICLPNYRGAAAPHNMARAAIKAEDLGYDSAWTTDHVVLFEPYLARFGGPVFYDPYMVLAYVASMTQRVKLGTTVIVLPYRNPVVQAKMLSTLDQLSNGRVIFGAAAGWADLEFNLLDVPFKERGERTDEYLRIMKSLWTEDEPSFKGKFFSLQGVVFEPKCVQQPHVPIWVGGRSRRAARRAAELGDAWHPSRTNLAEVKDRQERIRQVCQRIGRERPPELTVRMEFRLQKSPASGAREERPLGTGTAEQIKDDLKALQELGCTHVVLDFVAETAVQLWEGMDIFAQEIRPDFSG